MSDIHALELKLRSITTTLSDEEKHALMNHLVREYTGFGDCAALYRCMRCGVKDVEKMGMGSSINFEVCAHSTTLEGKEVWCYNEMCEGCVKAMGCTLIEDGRDWFCPVHLPLLPSEAVFQ